MRLLSVLPSLALAENLWTISNTEMALGPMKITFQDSPNVVRVEQPNIYYDNRGVYDNDPSPGESIEKFLFIDGQDRVVFKFTIYNDYIFHVQTNSKNVQITMENSDLGDCTTRLIGDKIFDLTRAKFKCGNFNWSPNFTCDPKQAGMHKRNGGADNVKIENWISLDVEGDGEMKVEHTAACANSGWIIEDIYTCQYDADYYSDVWQVDSQPKICGSYDG
jgi:hypothetical protein